MWGFQLLLLAVFTGVVCAGSGPPTMLPKHASVTKVEVKLINKTTVRVEWVKPKGIANDLITSYEVEVREMLHEMVNITEMTVAPPVTHAVVTNLHERVVYNLRVATTFTDMARMMSALVRFTTTDANASTVCLCDPYGSLNSTLNGSCTPNKLECVCRDLYVGSHCSMCTHEHYRKPRLPCNRCPCSTNTSNGQCIYDPSILRPRCISCKDHRTGPMCELCVRGYHLAKDDPKAGCVRCRCPKMASCHMLTGKCHECPNGTSGDYCELCAHGWFGHPPNCQRSAAPLHSSVTVVAALVALVVVAIALILGYWVMRVRARRKRLNAWSLELNRYELEQPGLVDSTSHAGLMMEEAPPPTAPTVAAAHAAHNNYGGARLQLRQSELSEEAGRGPGTASGGRPAAPLV